ncbi:MAG TPA: MFS transporter [Candidatus Limnocylindrales bacterium]|jgi:MFS family permease
MRESRIPPSHTPTTIAEEIAPIPDPGPAPHAPRVAGSGLAARLPALASPRYRRFIGGAFVGNVGAWMQATAQGWLVLGLTDSPGLLGLTSAAQTAPVLLLSLVAGVLADRVDRLRLLVAVQVCAAIVAAVLAALTATGTVMFWHVAVLAFLAGCTTALGTPAFQAVVSSLVERSAIGSAIALNSAQFNLSRIIGPAIAGLAIAGGGLALAFWVNALGLLLVALVLSTLRVSQASLVRAEASLWSNLVDGLRFVRANQRVAVLVLLAGVPALFVLNYLVLLPVYARDILGIGAPGLGLLTAAIGVGALTGAVSVALLRPSGGSGRLMLAGLAVGSSALIVFALSGWLPLSLGALAVLGGCQVAYYATTNTLIQVLVPARLRGRVMSLYILTSWGAIPFGNLISGGIAERFGAPVALAGGGVATLAILALVAIRYPEVRGLRASALIV